MNPLAPLSVKVATSFDACDVAPSTWDEAVARLGGPIYMTYDWLKTWWQFYGKGKQLRLFVFKSNQEIVGLIPIYMDQLGVRPFQLAVARILGANVPPKVFDPPLQPEWAADCFEQLLRWLFTKDHCDVISLGPIASQYAPWARFPTACARLSSLALLESGRADVHAVFHLPEKLDDYLESLGKNEQRNRRRYYELGNLRKQFAVTVDAAQARNSNLLDQFDRFSDQHGRQWEAEGRLGHFGSWPDGLAYNRALVEAQGQLDRVRFIRIWAGDQVLANHYTFAFGGRWFCELPSRAIGEGWDRFSLGSSGIVAMVGEAIKEGVHRIEGGLGHYEYKMRLKAEEYPTRVFRVVARRFSTRIRKCVFDAVRWLLLFGYQKLWYRHLMPHLPARLRRPQWMLWLRFDY